MKKIANKIEIELTLGGFGLVNMNGNNPPYRFRNEMIVDGKLAKNGSFGKENVYKQTIIENGEKKEIYTYKKIISDGLLRKELSGDENSVNADKLMKIDSLRQAYVSQNSTIIRGYMATNKQSFSLKRKSAACVTPAEQISNTITWLETKTAEGKRDDTSLFFKETCGEITYQSNILIDVKQLKFMSVDDNYDRLSILEKDVQPIINHINSRYGDGNAVYGNWATTHKNFIGEQGIILSNKVVTTIIRELIERALAIDIRRSGSYAKTVGIKIAIGYAGEPVNLLVKPKFVSINSLADYDKLVEDIEFGVDFLPIVAPTIEKVEKKTKNGGEKV